jgi:hypothetical protein
VEKTEITFIEDLHGVKDAHKWQVKKLKMLHPHVVLIEMLPYEPKYVKLCEQLISREISIDEFRKDSLWEKHWSLFDGYAYLLNYLSINKVPTYPIDQNLNDRYKIAETEKQIIKDRKRGTDVTELINKNRIELFLKRELIFSKNILNYVDNNNPKKVAVLVGGNHIDRLVNFFNFLDEYNAEGIKIERQLKNELYQEFKRIHIGYAKEKHIIELENPPLVPINTLRVISLK